MLLPIFEKCILYTKCEAIEKQNNYFICERHVGSNEMTSFDGILTQLDS